MILLRVHVRTNAIKARTTNCAEKWLGMISAKVDSAALVEKVNLLGSGTQVRAGARIAGDVETGEGVLIDSNAVIYGPVKLGKRSYVGPNSVIGFPDSAQLRELIRAERSSGKQLTTLGENCIVRAGTSIYANVQIANDVFFGHNVLVREAVTIGEHTKVGTNVVVDGQSRIGSRVSIQTGVYICTYSTVEDSVFLGPCCVFTNDKYVAETIQVDWPHCEEEEPASELMHFCSRASRLEKEPWLDPKQW